MARDALQAVVRLHDKLHVELKIAYLFDAATPTTDYAVEAWLLVPKNLGITERHFPRERLYGHLHANVRLKTPELALGALAAAGPGTPVARLRDLLARGAGPAEVESHVKLLGAIARSALREAAAAVGMAPTQDERAALFRTFVADCRALAAVLDSFDGQGGPELRYVDEGVRLFMNEHLFEELEHLAPAPSLRAEALAVVRSNLEHRRLVDGQAPPSPEGGNADYLFRKRVLKKYVTSVLFLETRSRPSGGGPMQHLLFAVAAGLAMAFALGAAWWASGRWGASSLPAVAVAVVAYMFKDRLKAVAQSWFQNVLARWWYDFRVEILDPASGELVGTCTEHVAYVEGAEVPEQVSRYRSREPLDQLAAQLIGDEALRYRRRLELNTGVVARLFPDVCGVHDILRLDVAPLLAAMDDPEVAVYALSGEGFVRTGGRKIYRVHLITRFSSGAAEAWACSRLVLTREGLERIEEVPLEGPERP